MQFEKWFAVDLLKPPVTPVDLGVLLCSGDDNSVRVGVRVKSGSADATVTGEIKGWVTLPSGVALMPFDGGSSGNSAWIDLPDDALGMAGRINIALRSVDTNEITVLLLAYATVRRVDADSYYDPDDIVSNLAETFAAAQQASEDAQQAIADASNIVSYNDQTSESHTDAEKKQARANIGAYSADETGMTPIQMTTGYYIATNSEPVSLTPHVSQSGTHTYAIVNCAPGDVFRISAQGGNSPYSWCFIDKDNHRVQYNFTTPVINEVLVSPVNATKLIINHREEAPNIGLKSYFCGNLSSSASAENEILLTGRHTNWVKGTINLSNGISYAATNQIVTNVLAGVSTGVAKITSTLEMYICAWDSNGTYVGYYDSAQEFSKGNKYKTWKEFDCTLYPNYRFNLVAQLTPRSDAIVPLDGLKVRYHTTDTTLKMADLAADSKTVGDALDGIVGTETPITMTSGYYIKTSVSPVNLTPVTLSGCKYAIVDCQAGEYFKITCSGGTSPRGYCFTDTNLNILEVSGAEASFTNEVIQAPTGAAKLIINDKSGAGVSYRGAKTRDIDEFNAEKKWLAGGLFKIFQRVGVIGDSLSVGCMQDPNTSEWMSRALKYSWVKQVGRDSGVPWLNFGQSGFNVLTWCSHATYGKVQMEATNNKCQAYIIGLGCNDEWNAGNHVDLGTTADIVDDPDTVATTYYGGYNRIIQLIKKLNPTAKIFCLTNPVAVESAGYNNAVRYIATQHYTTADNVFLVEFAREKGYLYNAQFGLWPDRFGVHFSPVGYRMIASIIERELDEVIRANQSLFMTVSWIPCDTADPTPNTMTE